MISHTLLDRVSIAPLVLCSSTVSASAQAPGQSEVARNLVRAGMVKTGNNVLVTGSVRDAQLMEDNAVEAMKVGAYPLISLG